MTWLGVGHYLHLATVILEIVVVDGVMFVVRWRGVMLKVFGDKEHSVASSNTRSCHHFISNAARLSSSRRN